MPIRFCLKKIGPGESNLIARMIIKNKGDRINNPISENMKSHIFLIRKYIIFPPTIEIYCLENSDYLFTIRLHLNLEIILAFYY